MTEGYTLCPNPTLRQVTEYLLACDVPPGIAPSERAIISALIEAAEARIAMLERRVAELEARQG